MQDTSFTVNKEQLEVTTSRVFRATPERLWQAHTDSNQITQWWGPGAYETTIDKNEIRVGGGWRYVQKAKDGDISAFRGEYKEIDEPHKLVRTFEYEPMAGHVLLETVTIEPLSDGQTKVTATAHYDNIQDLEGMVSMGMESGERESFERLAKLVEQ